MNSCFLFSYVAEMCFHSDMIIIFIYLEEYQPAGSVIKRVFRGVCVIYSPAGLRGGAAASQYMSLPEHHWQDDRRAGICW